MKKGVQVLKDGSYRIICIFFNEDLIKIKEADWKEDKNREP